MVARAAPGDHRTVSGDRREKLLVMGILAAVTLMILVALWGALT